MIQGYLEIIAFICCPNQLFRCSAMSSSQMISDLTYSSFSMTSGTSDGVVSLEGRFSYVSYFYFYLASQLIQSK